MAERIQLTPGERARFLAHVRHAFPATDDLALELTRNALARISSFPWATVEAAIVDHATRYGGRGRAFIVGAFLERLGERSEAARRETDALRAIARREEEAAMLDSERKSVLAERRRMRDLILESDAQSVDDALAYLRSLGWTVPAWPTSVEDWSPFVVVAMHDLLVDRDWPDVRETGGGRIPVRTALARVPSNGFGIRSGPE